MMVEDFAWKYARTAKGVSFSTDTPDTLSVFMGREDAESEAHFRQVVEMDQDHGWTVKVYGEGNEHHAERGAWRRGEGR
jgi:hypothetical protein